MIDSGKENKNTINISSSVDVGSQQEIPSSISTQKKESFQEDETFWREVQMKFKPKDITKKSELWQEREQILSKEGSSLHASLITGSIQKEEMIQPSVTQPFNSDEGDLDLFKVHESPNAKKTPKKKIPVIELDEEDIPDEDQLLQYTQDVHSL